MARVCWFAQQLLIQMQNAYNKLLNFVPATNGVASTGLPTLRCGSQLAKRYASL